MIIVEKISIHPSRFTTNLLAATGIANDWFQCWHFLPGMGCGDETLWWGAKRQRTTNHEGLDLLYWMDIKGERQELAPGTPVPVIYNGTVRAVTKDFLGNSVWVRHDGIKRDAFPFVLHTVYGHVTTQCQPGIHLTEGTMVGRIAQPQAGRAPAHLHLSLLAVHNDVPNSDLAWPLPIESSRIVILDPLPLVE